MTVRKKEGLVFHDTACAIGLINGILDGKIENIPSGHLLFFTY